MPTSDRSLEATIGNRAMNVLLSGIPTIDAVLHTPGVPLEGATRSVMEMRFGQPLGDVRVHEDPEAASSSRLLDAVAYTVGSHIVLGEVLPPGPRRDRVLAHELAHVLQQSASSEREARPISLGPTSLEDAADAAVAEVIAGRGAPPLGVAAAHVIQRQSRGARRMRKTVEVRWRDDWVDFYHEVVGTVSRNFRIPESELWQALHSSGSRFHRSELKAREGERIRLTVELSYDQGEVPSARWVSLQREERQPRADAPAQPRADAPAQPRAASVAPVQPTETMDAPVQRAPQATKTAEEELGLLPIEDKGAYPDEVATFTAYLIREGYIREVEALLPSTWRAMSAEELTKLLASRHTEEQLREQFLAKYSARTEIKARFRRLSVLTAIVIGLIWARDNIAEGEWDKAAAKVAGSALAAYAFNWILYARDPSAQAIMAAKGASYGRWLQGAARTNRFVNFFVRDLGRVMLIYDISKIFMSGGYGGPNIPFDLIVDIDVDDPTTWREPDQTLLDVGFNIWYRQTCTTAHPEACNGQAYLGKIEGSATWGLLKALDIAPHDVPGLVGRLYLVEGEGRFADRPVTAADRVLVLATGQRSGQLFSLRGHYREIEVRPANESALRVFGDPEPRYVPEYVLRPFANAPR